MIPLDEMKIIFGVLTQLLCLFFFLSSLYGVFGDIVLPGGEGFPLLFLVLLAYCGGFIAKVVKLPPLVGMLAAGIMFRNANFLPFDKYIPTNVSSVLRTVSLVIILLKAGLGLDPGKLRILKWIVLRLSFVPCLFEVISTTVLSALIFGLPWLWAIMLGFILSAVSAAVLVPGALLLEENQLGTDHGIPTLLMASVSLDNVAALTGFFISFNLITAEGNNFGWTFLQRLLEPFLGLLIGACLGVILWHIPARNTKQVFSTTYYKTALLCMGGMSLVFLSKRYDVSGVGAIGCVSLAFVASLRWRRHFEEFLAVKWITGLLWMFIEPFLFGLIGSEVTLVDLKNDIGYGVLIVVVGIVTRISSTLLALFRSSLEMKEKMFVALSWISKATVQAAVGTEALDYARKNGKSSVFIENGQKILTLSVLVILITAPLGALFMNGLQTRLLKKDCLPEDAKTETTPISPISPMANSYGT